MSQLRPSTIREILKVATQPDVISFAGGLPAPELFPVREIQAASNRVLETMGSQALQYSTSEGYLPLREYLVGEMAGRGITCSAEEILLTNGSQQGLNLLSHLFLDPGDVVLTENPTYLAAIQTFQSLEARFAPVPTDEAGILPESMPELIEKHNPKFLYTIPNFQNPTGITMASKRRKELYAIAEEHDLLIVEDDPYGRLRYRGDPIPPLKAMDGAGKVIYLSTFSKTLAPGLRLGWVVADKDLLHKLVILKQTMDLHTSSLDQCIAHEYCITNDVEEHVNTIRTAYGERYAVMNRALEAHMPRGFQWTHPEGGMFLWVTCPENLDTGSLFESAMAHKVCFVPGRDFFPDGSGTRFLRLNFSNANPDMIEEGIQRFATLCVQSHG
jgi:2-aminoadipate transaminase